jgi:cytochrome c biogenesis protein CcmG, thiol:disulfide interchange protein DsbE
VRCYHSVPILLAIALTAGCYRGSKPSDIGKPAPDFTVKDSDHTISLDQFRGKIVVLNFWASWCPPCVDELPSLEQMQAELRDKGVVVIGVSVDDSADDYHKFLKDHSVNFITVRDPGTQSSQGVDAPVSAKYGTFKFPETYIIDRKGVIRRKIIGAVDWNEREMLDFLTRIRG